MESEIKIQPFEMKNIPLILDEVEPLWSSPDWRGNFRRFYVESIVRSNIFENEFRFELLADKEFLAAAFFARRGDVSLYEKWFAEKSAFLSPEQKKICGSGKTFLDYMEEKTFSLMGEKDIKLSLFVSRKRGAGKSLLNPLEERLCKEGYERLFLWTDCECNWKWYEDHGFELLQKDEYPPFSSRDEAYMTYIYRLTLR